MTTITSNSECRQSTRRRLPAYGRKVIALREAGQAPTVAVLVADGWKPIPPDTVACVADADCQAAFDQNVVCGIRGVCASLQTERCELRVRPEGTPDEIAYIGSVLPRTGTYAARGVPLENAVQLAVEDWNDTTRLPGGRRVAWVACDSLGRPDDAAAPEGLNRRGHHRDRGPRALGRRSRWPTSPPAACCS
jgi:hypothetical protein